MVQVPVIKSHPTSRINKATSTTDVLFCQSDMRCHEGRKLRAMPTLFTHRISHQRRQHHATAMSNDVPIDLAICCIAPPCPIQTTGCRMRRTAKAATSRPAIKTTPLFARFRWLARSCMSIAARSISRFVRTWSVHVVRAGTCRIRTSYSTPPRSSYTPTLVYAPVPQFLQPLRCFVNA
jgi:hypothetical protein